MFGQPYFFFIIFFIQSVNGQNIIRASVASIPLSSTSTFTISCEYFDVAFEDKKAQEVNKIDLGKMQTLLGKSQIPRQKRKRIDVRGKITLYFDNKTNQTICFDEFGIFFYNNRFRENRRLLNFLINKKLVDQ